MPLTYPLVWQRRARLVDVLNVWPSGGSIKKADGTTVNASGHIRAHAVGTLSVSNLTIGGGGLVTITTGSNHGLATGAVVLILGVAGTGTVPNVNGEWTITGATPTTFTLNGSSLTGTYTSGGTVYVAQAVWTVGDKGSATGNPPTNYMWNGLGKNVIDLDANGRPVINSNPGYVYADGYYRYDVTDNASPPNILYTIDEAKHAIEGVSVVDFGAKGDGVTDDSDAIQAAVNHALSRAQGSTATTPLATPRVFFPAAIANTAGVARYLVKKSIKICCSTATTPDATHGGPGLPPDAPRPLDVPLYPGGSYTYVSLELYGEQRQGGGAGGLWPVLLSTHHQVPVFCIQAALGVSIVNLTFAGTNDLSMTLPSADALLNDSNFVFSTCRNSVSSPYAAIAIDPWDKAAPSDGGYPGQNGSADENGYNGPNMYTGGGTSATPSSGVSIQGCACTMFVAGVVISPTGATQQAENIYIKECGFNYNRVAIATCQQQARNLVIENVAASGQQFFFSTRTFGNSTHYGSSARMHNCSVSLTKYIFNVDLGYQTMHVDGLYCESTLSLGYLGPGYNPASNLGACFNGCTFTFWTRTGLQIDFHLFNFAPVVFTACSMAAGGLQPVVFFNNAPVTFVDCTFPNQNDSGVTFPIAFEDLTTVRFDNVQLRDGTMPNGLAFLRETYDASMPGKIRRQPLASPDYVIEGNWLRVVGTSKAKVIPVGGVSNTGTLSTPSSSTGTATWTGTFAAGTVNVGDIVYFQSGYSFTPQQYAYPGGSPSSYTSHAVAGVVDSISGNVISLKWVPQSVAAGTVAIEVRYLARYHDRSYGTYTATSTNITNTNFVPSMDGWWAVNDRIDHVAPSPTIPVGTYVTALSGTQVTVSAGAASTVEKAALMNANPVTLGGASFYRTDTVGSITVPAHTVVFRSVLWPGASYRSIAGAYVTIPDFSGVHSYGGLRVTYDDGFVKGPANTSDYSTAGAFDNGGMAQTTLRTSTSWTAALARDGAAIVKMEFYLRNPNTAADTSVPIGQFVFDGEQY